MFWKTAVFALFVVNVFASELEVTQVNKDHVEQILRAQCKKFNAEDKTNDVVSAGHAFVDCVKGLVNAEQLKKEVDDAKPNGTLDEVFKKYCAKTPKLKTCIHKLIDAAKPCLDDKSKELLPSAKNGTDQLIDFVCFKDGDRIALFIAEKGPECLSAKLNSIRECANQVKNSASVVGGTNATQILIDRCTKLDEVSACIVSALEGCDSPTPANMAESLFKFVRKTSPCNEALPVT